MAIGNWGADIVFRVSEREALLLQSLNRTVSAEWAAHSRIGLKNQSEFIGPGRTSNAWRPWWSGER